MEYRKLLEERGVIMKGHFRLSSGRHSDTYINKDAIYCDPELFQITTVLLAGSSYVQNGVPLKAMDTPNCDIITGPAIAGAILAAPIALRTGKQFVYPEKVVTNWVRTNHIGNGAPIITSEMQLRRVYDKVVKGKEVILIEDVITTGKSVIETCNVIGAAGGKVIEIRCIWNRSNFILQSEFVRFCIFV